MECVLLCKKWRVWVKECGWYTAWNWRIHPEGVAHTPSGSDAYNHWGWCIQPVGVTHTTSGGGVYTTSGGEAYNQWGWRIQSVGVAHTTSVGDAYNQWGWRINLILLEHDLNFQKCRITFKRPKCFRKIYTYPYVSSVW